MENKQFAGDKHARIYRSYRKDIPDELTDMIISFLKEKLQGPLKRAVDVGCGSGQATISLSPHFESVYGFDVSEAQIREAKASRSLPNVTFSVGPSEKLPFENGAVQLLSASSSIHWFDLEAFFAEARRVLCENGVLATYSYNGMKPVLANPWQNIQVDNLYKQFFFRDLGRHLQPQCCININRYRDIHFPFEEVRRVVDISCPLEGSITDIVNFLTTVSGFQSFKRSDSAGAEKCISYFKDRLCKIGAASNLGPDDVTTLHREFFLVLCRKVTSA